jgi:hypothetical protein
MNVHPPDRPPRRACGCRGGAATMLLAAADGAGCAVVVWWWCWCAYAPRIRFRRAFSRDRPDVIQCDMVVRSQRRSNA